MLESAIFMEHILGPKPRNAQVADEIGVPNKMAKILQSICEGVYLLVMLNL